MDNVNEKEIVRLTCDLIKKKTVNPPGDEYLCREIVVKAMNDLGMKTTIREKEKGRTNIIGKIGQGKPSIVLIAHLDVVPAGDGWKTDPFKPVVKNGKIFGRGALDNKGCFAVSHAAIKAFLKRNPKFKGTIYLLAVADEEMGSELGMKWLVKQGFKADFGLIPDSGLMNTAIIGEKGNVYLKITSLGKQAHGSTPELGINAIRKMAQLILAIKEIKWTQKIHPSFKPLTLNIGQIEGGYAPNIVPAKAEIKIDIRYPLGMNQNEIVRVIKSRTEKLMKKDKQARFKVELVRSEKPHLVSKNSFLCKQFRQAAKELGLTMELKTVGGMTVAKVLFFNDIPCLCHYPSKKEIAHMANEYVEIKNLVKSAELYALFLEKILC